MAKAAKVSAQVRQQLEGFAETQERELLEKICNTIDKTALRDLFDNGLLQDQAVSALILHVEVFVERVFEFSLSLELGRPIEQLGSDAVSRAVFVLCNLAEYFRRFGLPQEAAQKYKALELRNANLFLPNLTEQVEAGLLSKLNVSEPHAEYEIFGAENGKHGPELPELQFPCAVKQNPGFASGALTQEALQRPSATANEPTVRDDSALSQLPALTPEAQPKLELGIFMAGETLQEELLACWSRYFPPQIRGGRAFEPDMFFQAFYSYGTAIYDAYATALLACKDYREFSNILNAGLKTSVCDRIAPLGGEGDWQRFLLATWRFFDHPRHAELHGSAVDVVDAFRDVARPYWRGLVDSLHKSISRRTRHWLIEWQKLHLATERDEQTRADFATEHSGSETTNGSTCVECAIGATIEGENRFDTAVEATTTHPQKRGKIADGEGIETRPPRKRGRPTEISDERKLQALGASGGKARAKILYDVKYPTPQQIKNVPAILRHFGRKKAE